VSEAVSGYLPSQVSFEIARRPNETTSGLLVLVTQTAQEIGFFETLTRDLNLRMKVVRYSHQNKLATLVASLVVGCRNTLDIQTKLVPDVVAAGQFGMARFPDQSQINSFIRALGTDQVTALEKAHQQLLNKNSRAGDRANWLELPSGRRILPLDLDQTPLVTRSTRATGVAKGHMGRKRGQVGYKKSVALLGGDVREVLWQRLEPGNTHGQEALPIVLERLAALGEALGVRAEDTLVRGDSQYGALEAVRQCQAARRHYLVKGYTPLTARKLADSLPETAVWTFRGKDSNGSSLWLTDLGEVPLSADHEPADVPPVRTRVVLLVRVGFHKRRKRGKGWRETVTEKVVSHEHYLTDLSAEELRMEEVIALYNGRETEESFFRAEQDAFGADHLRTYKGEGEAAFLWILASTVNLLRWTQARRFQGTEIERAGLTKLVTQVMQIPATIIEQAGRWIVLLPETLRLARHLVNAWIERYHQLPLPFAPDTTAPNTT
jgi:hypothetical protein